MVTPPNLVAAKAFLNVVLVERDPTLATLTRSLDQLAVAYHETPATEVDDSDQEPPDPEFDYKQIAARFPQLGYYSVVDPGDGLDQPVMVGDAIDDLLDISRDLHKVLWRFENVSVDDAHWHFQFLFEAHWGQHLRELSVYLHNAEIERP
jgi:hypothetical protein